MSEAWRALVGSDARTDPGSPDRALRGRTYAIPFDRVWNAALSVADGELRGWKLVSSDDVGGIINAEATSSLPRRVTDVRVTIGLDSDGQTRVDAQASERRGSVETGGNGRRLKRFMTALDHALAATPAQILDATKEISLAG
jgi:hypothetical protein